MTLRQTDFPHTWGRFVWYRKSWHKHWIHMPPYGKSSYTKWNDPQSIDKYIFQQIKANVSHTVEIQYWNSHDINHCQNITRKRYKKKHPLHLFFEVRVYYHSDTQKTGPETLRRRHGTFFIPKLLHHAIFEMRVLFEQCHLVQCQLI